MISAVPQPSAVARMMWARHTCFCGALRSATIASSSTAIRPGDSHDNACSHNCSADFGIVRMNQK